MTYEQYWYGDPLMVRAFYKAEKLRQDRKNSELWLAGIYFQKAIESTVGNMFLEEGSEPAQYPQFPIGLETEENQLLDDEKEKQDIAKAKLYMYNMVRAGKDWGSR